MICFRLDGSVAVPVHQLANHNDQRGSTTVTKTPQSVIVIGGGIIGLASAHYLLQAGLQVRVIDQGEIGQECSHGNCGLICPDHIMPLPRPGALRKGLSAMFKPNGPLSIEPGLNFRLWAWLFSFASNCNERKMLEAGKGRHAILHYSREFYTSFIKENNIECDWEQNGCLFVYGSVKTLDA
jgi:D-amino-acid dehydrogenase